jgi:hypothetical protein
MNTYKIEIQDQNITNRGIAAIIDFYQTLAIDSLHLDDVHAFATGVNSMFLNVVIDARKYKINSSTIITECYNFFNKHTIPWAWFVVPGSNNNDLEQNNFAPIEEAPAMYFDLSKSLADINPLFNIQELDNKDDLQLWIEPIKEGFGADPGDDSFRLLNVKLLHDNCEKLKHFVLYHNNDVVSSGTLFISNDAVMLHNLATKTSYTKRGFGSALTMYMMHHAKQLGYRHCFLDSSEEGFNLYSNIGFKVYSTTTIYTEISNK